LKKLRESHDILKMKAKNHGPKKTIKGKTTKQKREGRRLEG
jgi:hypothetical protein